VPTLFERCAFVYGCAATAAGIWGVILFALGWLSLTEWSAAFAGGIVLPHLVFYMGQRHEFRPRPQPVIRVTRLRLRMARAALAGSLALVLLSTGLFWWSPRGNDPRTVWSLQLVSASLYLTMSVTIAASAGLCLDRVFGPRIMAWREPHKVVARLWRHRHDDHMS
jgi:hypothetical protein